MHATSLRYLHLPPGADLPALQLPPFLAVVLVDEDVEETWMWDAARWLVASGCRYALCRARDGEAWREAVDDAALEAADYEDVPAERRVLATAHDAGDEDVDEVFWFARHRAAHPGQALDTVLIVHVAAAPDQEALEASYARA